MSQKYKYFRLIFSLIFFYISGCLFLYLVSAICLINNKVINFSPFKNFQINFYNQIGYRNIWQAQEQCIDFDNELIYVPKIGKCFFQNPEFTTELNFTKFGRYQNINNLDNSFNKIFIIGDSHAMGWGVNDNETFSFLIGEKLNIGSINLAVSSYATRRELLRLKKSNIVKKNDLIIIQYASNDFDENIDLKDLKKDKIDFNRFKEKNKISNFEKIRKIVRYSLIIPLEIIFKKDMLVLDWNGHKNSFFSILNSFDFLSENKIILININTSNIFFKNFYKSDENPNVFFLNIDFIKNDFFTIDQHLNSLGHKKTAETIVDFIKLNKLLEIN